jgi:ferredoxin-NADP reductase
MLLMAAGVGITPIRALLEDTPYAAGETVLLYRCADEHDAVLGREVEELAERRGVDVRYLMGPRRYDGSWLPADSPLSDVASLKEFVPDVADCDIFICGPAPWMKAVRRAAVEAGANRAQIHTEDFAW